MITNLQEQIPHLYQAIEYNKTTNHPRRSRWGNKWKENQKHLTKINKVGLLLVSLTNEITFIVTKT